MLPFLDFSRFFRNAFFVDENESVIGDNEKKFFLFLNDVRGKTFALVKTDDGVEEQMVS